MFALLKARSWTIVLVVCAIATLMAFAGGGYAVNLPMVSSPVPLAVVLPMVTATTCIVPLQPCAPPLDHTFARETSLTWVRPVVGTVLAAVPTLVASTPGVDGSTVLELTRVLVLAGLAFVAFSWMNSLGWAVPLTVGMAAVIVDAGDPAEPVTSFLERIGLVGGAIFWLVAMAIFLHDQARLRG